MGCVEAYVYAFFRLILGASTPLTVQAQATAETLLFLVSAYLLVRRFFGRQAALPALLLLALPPGMLAIWLGKIRGYIPWLILGNVIFYLLFHLHELPEAERARGKIFGLGLLLGIAWWVNPLALYHCLTAAVLLVAIPRLRRLLWTGSFRSLPAPVRQRRGLPDPPHPGIAFPDRCAPVAAPSISHPASVLCPYGGVDPGDVGGGRGACIARTAVQSCPTQRRIPCRQSPGAVGDLVRQGTEPEARGGVPVKPARKGLLFRPRRFSDHGWPGRFDKS